QSVHSWFSRSSASGTGRVATSTSIQPFYRQVLAPPTTRSRRPAHPPIVDRTTCARQKRSFILITPRRSPHDSRIATIRSSATRPTLVDGGLHPGHVLRRRWHGLDHRAEISFPHRHSQDTWRRHPRTRVDSSGAETALRRSRIACRPASDHEARGPSVTLPAI